MSGHTSDNALRKSSSSHSRQMFDDEDSLFNCSLQKLTAATLRIKDADDTDARKKAIVSTGFGGILQISASKLPEKLCRWLVDRFDTDTCSLNVHGVKLGLRLVDVTTALGISDGGETIASRKQLSTIDKLRSSYNLPEWPINLDKLLQDVVSPFTPLDEFTLKFTLYVFGSFLVPTFKGIVHEEIACALGNPRDLYRGNWATYVRDFLCEGIKNYRRKVTMNCCGCVYLLLILYAENAVLHGYIPRFSSQQELPTRYWNNILLKKLAKNVEKIGGLGVVTVKVLAQTEYNEHTLMPNYVQELCNRVNVLENFVNSQSWLLHYYSDLVNSHMAQKSLAVGGNSKRTPEKVNVTIDSAKEHDYNFQTLKRIKSQHGEETPSSGKLSCATPRGSKPTYWNKFDESYGAENCPVDRKLFSSPPSGGFEDNVNLKKCSVHMDHPSNEVLSGLLSQAYAYLSSDLDKNIAEYIFSDKLSIDEKLINHVVIQATRPGCRFLDDIMTLVPCMLTHEERMSSRGIMSWFIPYDLVRRVFNFNLTLHKAMKEYAHRFMSSITRLSKIFIPLNDGGFHWYLMVIEIDQKCITCLDSAQCQDNKGRLHRLSQINKMAKFMEDMMQIKDFQEKVVIDVPKIQDYDVHSPSGVPQQSKGSLDCGLWVCEWMRKYQGAETYKIEVNELTRVQLAVNLVMKGHNTERFTVIAHAMENAEASLTI